MQRGQQDMAGQVRRCIAEACHSPGHAFTRGGIVGDSAADDHDLGRAADLFGEEVAQLALGTGIAALADPERRGGHIFNPHAARLHRAERRISARFVHGSRQARRAPSGADQAEGGSMDQRFVAPLGLCAIEQRRANALRRQQRQRHGEHELAEHAARHQP